MVNVMIVDDERLAVKYYTQLINWKFYGFEIIGTAYDGKEALHILETKETDIIITDIKMPVMDGIELAKMARKSNPDIHILFVTSYTDFNYTYNALKLGADDYVMKDAIDGKMLVEKLLEIKRKINVAKNENSYKIEKVLEEVFTYGRIEANRRDWLGEHAANILDEKYLYLYIKKDRPISAAASFFQIKSEMQENNQFIVEECKNFGNENFHPVSVFRYAGGIVSILKATEWNNQKFFEYTKELQNGLDSTNQETFTLFTISRPLILKDAGQIFANSESIASTQIFLGRMLIIEIDSEKLLNRNIDEAFDVSFVESCIKTNDHDTLRSYLIDFFEQTSKAKDFKALDYAFYNCLNCLKKFGSELHDIKTGKMFWTELYQHEIDMMYTAQSAIHWILEKFEDLFSILENKSSEKYSKDTLEIIKYIINHYGKPDLDLDSISKGVAMSIARTESKFKLETGLTLIDYLNKYRIQKAMELLKSGDVKIYEISERVGFTSSQYFSRVFKKYTSLTPIEYRKRLTDEIYKKHSN